jgi:hypothetical protein
VDVHLGGRSDAASLTVRDVQGQPLAHQAVRVVYDPLWKLTVYDGAGDVWKSEHTRETDAQGRVELSVAVAPGSRLAVGDANKVVRFHAVLPQSDAEHALRLRIEPPVPED